MALESPPGCVRTDRNDLIVPCERCGAPFMQLRDWHHFCSQDCRQKARHEWEVVIRPPKRGEDTPGTFRDRLAAYLRKRPNQWIDGLELGKVGGAYAFRTRLSDCRVQLGMRIVNRQRKVGRVTVSEYCYQPEAS